MTSAEDRVLLRRYHEEGDLSARNRARKRTKS